MTTNFDPDFATPADWATLYREQGIQIVPGYMPSEVRSGQSWKRPLLKSWTEFQENLIPDDMFLTWYGPGGLYANRLNMGVICGHASNNTFVIDLDIHKHPAATQWWLGLLAVHNNGLELETVEQRTGGGGLQKLFHAPANWAAPTNKTSIGIDIRGQGGFAMLCPSIHESGQPYQWLEGRSPAECEILMAPDWLLREVEELVRKHGGGHVSFDASLNLQDNSALKSHVSPQEDGFGALIDGRESYMRDMVWAAVVNWHRECPLPINDALQLERAHAEFEVYVRSVEPQRIYLNVPKKEDQLEAEGRGWSEWWAKWQRACRQWDGKVAEEARKAAPQKPGTVFRLPEPGPVNQPISGPLEWLDMSNWDDWPVPARKWAIRDRVPLNQVGLFSGEGGTGKSIIELMKDVAHVAGKDWLGSLPEQGPAFYLGAEDEADEIHIRLAAIAKHYGVTFRELTTGGLKVLPLLGQDSMLCVQSGRGNHVEVTPLYRRLYEAAGDLKPKNISIDTLSRAFGGDEINRVQVYAFAMHMQALAKVAQGSVTILSHPSLTGLASGSGLSGSTAWQGAFRFRQYLKGIKDEGDPAEDDLRELEFKKNQYGPRGKPVILRYKDGLFLPVNGATDPERVAREAKIEGLFVSLLRKVNMRGDRVSHHSTSPFYYAPKVFADEPEAKQQRFRKEDFEDAMKRLMNGNRVLTEKIKVNWKEFSRLVLAPGT